MKDNTEGSRQMKKTGGTDNVPYKFLARLDNRMPLRYRKLWFQLTCPQGRIRIIVHSNTEDAASCTAEVYLNKKDSRPVSTHTAACSRRETENFLKAAENRALTGALIQAGFTRPERIKPVHAPKDSPSPIPEHISPSAGRANDRQLPPLPEKGEASQANPIAKEEAVPVQPAQPAPAANVMADSFQAVGTSDPIPFPGSGKAPVSSVSAQLSGEISEQKRIQKADLRQTADPVADTPDRSRKAEGTISPAAAKETETAQIQMAYTSSTPVEEIKRHMTLEDALHTRIDMGVCKGMTLEEISIKRFPNLRWYVYGYRGNDNILRAAAQIVWDSLQEGNKAG